MINGNIPSPTTDLCSDSSSSSYGDDRPTYAATFGHYTQTTWTDVRHLAWPELTTLLTTHSIGPKEGTCIVPATFRDTRRHKADADQIDVAFLDSDGGATLEEITTALQRRGWAAVVSSTHSHMTTNTRIKRSHWEAFRDRANNAAAAPEKFLEQEKGYLPRVAAGATISEEDGEYIHFHHQPCPKFRVVIPLLKPWRASNYASQDTANAAWKERVEALAAALALDHDQSCTDTSRLFFLPRRSASGPAAETIVVDGTLCDLFALPSATTDRSGTTRNTGAADEFVFECPKTGEVVDLRAWGRESGRHFRIVDALKARRPGVFVGKVVDDARHHIHCVNEEQHTQGGADAATFIANPQRSTTSGFVYHCRHAHCDGHDRLYFVRKMLEQGWLTIDDLRDAAYQPKADGKPEIRVVAGKLPEAVDQAEQALLTSGAELYQRGSSLVRPGKLRLAVVGEVTDQGGRIVELGDHALVEEMTKVADWKRYDARAKAWVTTDAPMKVASTYRERRGHWRLPVLSGIITAPTLRRDGSVVDQVGYDAATGLLLDLSGNCFPPIPDSSTIDHARVALGTLQDLVKTFPFVSEADRSVLLSAVLTSVIRRILPTAPLHAFTAPTPGTGKSLLVDLVSVISTGRTAGVISQGKTEEELEKRLGALLVAGDLLIAIDNCEAPLRSAFLCAMLTQPVVRSRILGRSEAPEVPSDALIMATGNNLVLAGDLPRRSLMCHLDACHERPELRIFNVDPIEEAKRNRPALIVAALTILRAYHLAGRPNSPPPLGSFVEWSNWVRGALMWLGEADPVVTMEAVREMDPEIETLNAVLEHWDLAVGSGPITVGAMIGALMRAPATGAGGGSPATTFRDLLLGIAGEGVAINGKKLGKWLTANAGRIVNGRRIVRGGLSRGLLRWGIETAEGKTNAA